MMSSTVILAGISTLLLLGCSRSNNLLMGRVEANVGGHNVVVTDCYRTSVDPPRRIDGGDEFMPCRDADVVIRGGELLVNGQSYGTVKPGDAILVDHGVVSVNERKATPAPQSSSKK